MDANAIRTRLYAVAGTVRKLWDGREYVVILGDFPTNLREIVPCSECVWFDMRGWCDNNDVFCDGCDFCSWGRRRKGHD